MNKTPIFYSPYKALRSSNSFIIYLRPTKKQFFINTIGLNYKFSRFTSGGRLLAKAEIYEKKQKSTLRPYELLQPYFKSIFKSEPVTNFCLYVRPFSKKSVLLLKKIRLFHNYNFTSVGFSQPFKTVFKTARRIKKKIRKKLLLPW